MIAAMSKIRRPTVVATSRPFKALEAKGFDILFLAHSRSIITGEFPQALIEICETLNAIDLPISEIIGSGGGETKFTQRLRKSLSALGWKKHIFEIEKTIDGVPRESTSHEVDHVKRYEGLGSLALSPHQSNAPIF
jgi:Restriction endonuclease BglII